MNDEKIESELDTPPRSEWILLSQGAEARVWKLKMTTNGNDGKVDVFVVCKERFSKAYRHPDLDARLTKSRCRSEAKILQKCEKKSKIRVPKIVRVSPPNLYLEYLAGPSVKSFLQQQQKIIAVDKKGIKPQRSMLSEKDIAHRIGELVGRLHNIGIVHGDLTTSNMIILEGIDDDKDELSFQLALIDFGLSKSTFGPEEQAVDLYVLERALLSTHPNLIDNFFDLVLEKYKSTIENDATNDEDAKGPGNTKKRKNSNQTAIQRLEQVRMRGRKRECFG